MSYKKSVQTHIAYIIDTLDTIKVHTPPTEDAFMNDLNAQDATLMRLQDIGEQLVHIRDQYPAFYEAHHDDTWPQIIGLRNIISHGYREVDFAIIWSILQKRLPEFERQIHAIAHVDM